MVLTGVFFFRFLKITEQFHIGMVTEACLGRIRKQLLFKLAGQSIIILTTLHFCETQGCWEKDVEVAMSRLLGLFVSSDKLCDTN